MLEKDDPERKHYRQIRVAAAVLITDLRGLLEAFKHDPSGQKLNLDRNIRDMRKFQRTVVSRMMVIKGADPLTSKMGTVLSHPAGRADACR